VKAMIYHGTTDTNGVFTTAPINFLRSRTSGVPPIDWYWAEASQGDPSDGVARTLVDDQNAAGYWWGHNYSDAQYMMEPPWQL